MLAILSRGLLQQYYLSVQKETLDIIIRLFIFCSSIILTSHAQLLLFPNIPHANNLGILKLLKIRIKKSPFNRISYEFSKNLTEICHLSLFNFNLSLFIYSFCPIYLFIYLFAFFCFFMFINWFILIISRK